MLGAVALAILVLSDDVDGMLAGGANPARFVDALPPPSSLAQPSLSPPSLMSPSSLSLSQSP